MIWERQGNAGYRVLSRPSAGDRRGLPRCTVGICRSSELSHELPFNSQISRPLMVRFGPNNRHSLAVRLHTGMAAAGTSPPRAAHPSGRTGQGPGRKVAKAFGNRHMAELRLCARSSHPCTSQRKATLSPFLPFVIAWQVDNNWGASAAISLLATV